MSNHYFYCDPSPQSREEGPLAGNLIAVQSNMSVQGWPTTAGSLALEGYVALEDATVVKRLRDRGGVIVGSTYMSELGFGLSGDTAETVLKDGKAEVVLVTDTMGEARMAAAGAGVYGFKPTHGLVSRFGLIGLVPSMECYGVMAGTPQAISAVMDGISGYDERDFSMPDREKPDFSEKADISRLIRRVGVIPEATAMLDESERKAFRDGIRKFSDLGLAVSDVSFKDFDLFPLVHGVIGSVEASSSAGKYDGVRYGHRAQGTKNWNEMYLKSRGESFGLLVKSYLFQGAYFQYENYETFEKACRIRSCLVKDMNDLFSKVGVLVLPTKRLHFDARKAETVQDIYGAFALTLPANVAGLPALQMPGFIAEGAGGIGMQLIGPAFSDAELLALANHLSQQKGMN